MNFQIQNIQLELKELDRRFKEYLEKRNAPLLRALEKRFGMDFSGSDTTIYIPPESPLKRILRSFRNLFSTSRPPVSFGIPVSSAPPRFQTYAWEAEQCDEELHRRLDEICRIYLSAEREDRELLRESLNGLPSVQIGLFHHPGWCALHIKSLEDRDFLITGIAAISLEDGRNDPRDNSTAIGYLYMTCLKAGIQPSVDLNKIASLSNSEPVHRGECSTKDFLLRFEESQRLRTAKNI